MKGITATTAARLQRCALFLQGHDYNKEYKSSKSHASRDGLSRLPFKYCEELPDSDLLDIHNVSQIECLQSVLMALNWKHVDTFLSKVLDYTLNGQTCKRQDDNLNPFYMRRNKLSFEQGFLMWGLRI